MSMRSGHVRALWSALYGVLGFWFLKLAFGIGLVALHESLRGNAWAPLLLPAAAASAWLAAVALVRLARLMRLVPR